MSRGEGKHWCLSDCSRLKSVGRKLQEETPLLRRTGSPLWWERMEVRRGQSVHSFQRSGRTETPGCP